MLLLRAAPVLLSVAAFAAPAGVQSAAQRGVALIQKVNDQWRFPCVSCHHQVLGALALQSARSRGIPVNEPTAQRTSTRDYKLLLDLDAAVRVEQLIDPAMSEGSLLIGAHAAGVAPSLVTAVYARHLARTQMPDGHWAIFDNRPPHSHSAFTGAAIAAHAIQLYHPSPQPFVARARRWLAAAIPQDTEDATFQLLGLLWTAAPPKAVAASAARLASLQQPSGAWSQTSRSKEPDAYSTAQALYALLAAKAWRPDDVNSTRSVQWLLDHQATDGSWHVKTRLHTPAPISPPYFESGFPYGHDQFLSMAATAWAVRALAESLPALPSPARPLPLPSFDDSGLPWARAALFGTPRDLANIPPNAATPAGTSALMMAADQPRKVELLLQRGANPNAVSKAGYDALMIAALHYGNSKSVKRLLRAGVPASPSRNVRNQASALAHAVMANDPGMVKLLLSNGASPMHGFGLLGSPQPVPLLNLALTFGSVPNIRLLAQAGVPVDSPDADGMTPLSWAALSLRPAAVKALLELGANPNNKDRFGLTPLDHSKAVADAPGDTTALLLGR